MNKSVVHWVSQKQSMTALGSCEAELNAAVFGSRMWIGVRNMLGEMTEVEPVEPQRGDPELCSLKERRRTIPNSVEAGQHGLNRHHHHRGDIREISALWLEGSMGARCVTAGGGEGKV